MGITHLRLSYLELFAISPNKEVYVADLMKFPNGVLIFLREINFVRAIQDWELESLTNFLDSIYGVSLREVGDDKICWKPTMGRTFAVRSYYQILTKSIKYRSVLPMEDCLEAEGPF